MKRIALAAALLLVLAAAASAKPVVVPPPPDDLAGPDHPHRLIATAETWQRTVASAKCGDRIELSGDFPDILRIYNLKPSCPVVIDGAKTTLSNLTVRGASNWIVENARFGATKFANININDSDHISVRDSHFEHSGSAAIGIISSSYIWVRRNHVTGSYGDGFDVIGSHNIVTANNICADNIPTPIHPDCVQVWSIKGQAPVSDVWILDNVVNGPTDGFTGFDHDFGGFDRVYLVGNTVATTVVWAGEFNACRHCIMAHNKATTLPGQKHGWGGARWFMTDGRTDTTPDSGRMNLIQENENGIGF